MANEKLTVEVRAKNALSRGLSEVSSAFSKFGKTLGRIWEAAWKPAAVALAAYAAMSKAVNWVSEALDRRMKAIAKIQGENEEAAVKRVADSYARLSENIKAATDQAARNNKVRDETIAAADKQAIAVLDLDEAQQLANEPDEDARKAIKDRYDALRRELTTRRAIADESRKQSDLEAEAKAKREAAADLDVEAANAIKEAQDAQARAVAMNAVASKARLAANQEFYRAEAKAASDNADKLTAEARKLTKERERTIAEAVALERQAANQTVRIVAAVTEGKAEAAKAELAAIQEARAAYVKSEQEAADKIKRLREGAAKDAKDVEKQIADETKKQAADAARTKIDAIQDQIDAQKRLAEMTVRQFIDEQRAQKNAAKQWERDQARAERLRGGRKGAEFVAAVDQIRAARAAMPGLQGQLQGAQADLAKIQAEGNKTLADMKAELSAIHADQIKLLSMG